MPLSCNEIKTRAATFTNEWKDEVSEDAEAKNFWDDFFNVFGISRRKAHQALDKSVDLCYRPQPFINETKRIEYLFELYDKYTAGLFVKEKKNKKK